MKKYKVIYCINDYIGKSGAGASNALRNLIIHNPYLESYKLYCHYYYEEDLKDIVPIIATGKEVVEEFARGDYQCIHWIRSNRYELYTEIIQEGRKRKWEIPIISTICQQPDAPNLFLAPVEVKYPSRIIFIDNQSFNHKYFTFIPETRRKMIRFGGWTSESKALYDTILNNKVASDIDDKVTIYGRGGTLNKCPRTMFDVFDKISYPKKFVIVGDGIQDDIWIQDELEKRKGCYEIILYDAMPYQNWLEVASSFDVFLYHLPLDAYSSTDGTMLSAMWLKKPVVYYGPDAPKEVLKDGYNSKIAQKEEDIAKYCDELAKNKSERIRLGENARKTCEGFQSREQFYEKINQQYKEVTALPPIRLSYRYLCAYTLYMFNRDRSWPLKILKNQLNHLFKKLK